MIHWTVFKYSSDRHFVRFEPERQVPTRELMTHNLVARAPFLHRRACRDISAHGNFQSRLAVGWVNGEGQIYRSVSIVLLDEVRFLGLGHSLP